MKPGFGRRGHMPPPSSGPPASMPPMTSLPPGPLPRGKAAEVLSAEILAEAMTTSADRIAVALERLAEAIAAETPREHPEETP